jgi:nucleoside-diphosphate-sugar epimerase
MEKLLIMGGSYFIGKGIVEQLKDSFDTFVLNRGNRPLNDPKVTELKADRNNPDEMKSVLENFNFDYIVDVSGLNKLHEEILINSIHLHKIKKFIFISSSAVYNIHKLTAPFKEDDELGGESPFRDYARNKVEAEAYLMSVIDKDKLIMLRPPVVYGEENYVLRERLIFKMIEENMKIYIPSTNNRIQFVYANDLAVQIKEALFNKIPAGIYNVGNLVAPHFDEWVHLCEKVVGKRALIEFIDTNKEGIEARSFFPFFDYDNILSVEKIRKYSDIETDMIEGLKRAYEDYLLIKDTLVIPEKLSSQLEKIDQLTKK